MLGSKTGPLGKNNPKFYHIQIQSGSTDNELELWSSDKFTAYFGPRTDLNVSVIASAVSLATR